MLIVTEIFLHYCVFKKKQYVDRVISESREPHRGWFIWLFRHFVLQGLTGEVLVPHIFGIIKLKKKQNQNGAITVNEILTLT